MAQIKIYDLECFPNLFSLGSINHLTREKELYWICEDNNDLESIIEYTKKKDGLIGYNNEKYDNLLLHYIVKNKTKLLKMSSLDVCEELKGISNDIIKHFDKKNRQPSKTVYELAKMKLFSYIDLFTLFNTIERTSLKQVSINLKYNNVQTLPYPHDKWLTPEEIKVVLDYNFNDVDITELLYERRKPDIALRKDINKRYAVDVLNKNDTGIAKTILDKYYSEATGLPIESFKELRSYNAPFCLNEVVLPCHSFRTKPFQDLLKWYNEYQYSENTDVNSKDAMYILNSKKLTLSLGLGGIHSKDEPGIFESKEGITIKDGDVASLYPMLMVINGFKPRHCLPELLVIFKTLVVERLKDKAEGRKTDAETKKKVINSIYGLMGSAHYWLRDSKTLLQVTVNGQLFLCKWVEDLQIAGIKVISCNTDGVVCELRDDQIDLYYKISKEWSSSCGFDLEFVDYSKYVRKDVNNYVSLDSKGNVKQKGKYFLTKQELHKGYYYPIIAKCLNAYFLKGKEFESIITESEDIYDFMVSQKADEDKFQMELVSIENCQIKKEKLQKNNRWIVTKTGGKLIKYEIEEAKEIRLNNARDKGKKITEKTSKNKILHLDKDNYVTITNRVVESNAKKYDLNYNFYINQCWEVIRQIKPLYIQTNLF